MGAEKDKCIDTSLLRSLHVPLRLMLSMLDGEACASDWGECTTTSVHHAASSAMASAAASAAADRPLFQSAAARLLGVAVGAGAEAAVAPPASLFCERGVGCRGGAAMWVEVGP